MTKQINDTVETLSREQLQDWGKSPLNTGWAEKPAKGFFILPWNLLQSLFQAAALYHSTVSLWGGAW